MATFQEFCTRCLALRWAVSGAIWVYNCGHIRFREFVGCRYHAHMAKAEPQTDEVDRRTPGRGTRNDERAGAGT